MGNTRRHVRRRYKLTKHGLFKTTTTQPRSAMSAAKQYPEFEGKVVERVIDDGTSVCFEFTDGTWFEVTLPIKTLLVDYQTESLE